MSTTMVVTMASPALITDHSAPPTCCPGCGYALTPLDQTQAELLQAQARISDLETQVRLLNQKATAAVDRWADYEDELTKLRAQISAAPPPPPPPPPEVLPPRASFLQTGTNRLSALLAPRKSAPNIFSEPARPPNPRTASTPAPPSPTERDLLEALSREQTLRKEAEGKVAATSREVEELSAALFEQANEMVAEERRARAKLEARVDELERRDVEKRRRLERLEGAMQRIERVRELLAETEETEHHGDQKKEQQRGTSGSEPDAEAEKRTSLDAWT